MKLALNQLIASLTVGFSTSLALLQVQIWPLRDPLLSLPCPDVKITHP